MTASGIDIDPLPAVSVVMPLYNKEREVGRAVASVLAQTVEDFELVVVNDGSTDGSLAVVLAVADPRIRLVEQENAGVSAARNRGVAAARADVIAFLDADDEWKPEFLETIVRLRSLFPSCEVFATSYMLQEATGVCRTAAIRGIPAYPCEGTLADYFHVAAHSDPPICSSSVAITRKALLAIGGFPEGISSGEDLLTWARLASRFDIAYNRTPLARFWTPVSMKDRPTRVPQLPDTVAERLLELLETTPPERSHGLREYLALWHRMRAVIFIKLNRTPEARQEISRAARYVGMNGRLRVLGLISRLPGTLPSKTQLFFAKKINMIRSVRQELCR